jgi:hypothetical protein
VFGEISDVGPGFVPPPGRCRFLDVVVPAFRNGDDELELDDKAIFDSIRDVARNYPDVRVFNLSLGSYLALDQYPETVRQERRAELQDLDNFAFEHDVVVVVSAGNTRRGVVPNVDYPRHVDEPDWRLGAWAAGFNTFVVGGFVPRPNTDGVARRQGWPSPFTRVGPGVAGAPVPGFSAGAGDCTDAYQWKAGLGVWTANKVGGWEDVPGTSHAAPRRPRGGVASSGASKVLPNRQSAIRVHGEGVPSLGFAPRGASRDYGCHYPNVGEANAWSRLRATDWERVGERAGLACAGSDFEDLSAMRSVTAAAFLGRGSSLSFWS